VKSKVRVRGLCRISTRKLMPAPKPAGVVTATSTLKGTVCRASVRATTAIEGSSAAKEAVGEGLGVGKGLKRGVGVGVGRGVGGGVGTGLGMRKGVGVGATTEIGVMVTAGCSRASSWQATSDNDRRAATLALITEEAANVQL
jgi:hypothetical protein